LLAREREQIVILPPLFPRAFECHLKLLFTYDKFVMGCCCCYCCCCCCCVSKKLKERVFFLVICQIIVCCCCCCVCVCSPLPLDLLQPLEPARFIAAHAHLLHSCRLGRQLGQEQDVFIMSALSTEDSLALLALQRWVFIHVAKNDFEARHRVLD